jgi:hypothetical protein
LTDGRNIYYGTFSAREGGSAKSEAAEKAEKAENTWKADKRGKNRVSFCMVLDYMFTF